MTTEPRQRTDAESRDAIQQLAAEWFEHTANGWDVLASACLDEIEAIVAAVRP